MTNIDAHDPEEFISSTASFFRTSTGREATDLVIGHILDQVIAGEMIPGERLNASKISDTLNVSVVPVREAIHFLAGEGVVELMALKGARIREMDADEVVDWWHIFEALGGIGFRAAAAAIAQTPALSTHIEQALETIENTQITKSSLEYLLALNDFHRAANRIGNKAVIDEAIRRLQTMFWLSVLPQYIPFEQYGKVFTANYHHIAGALMRGDGESAASIFSHHVAWSSAIILGERPDPDAPWSPGP